MKIDDSKKTLSSIYLQQRAIAYFWSFVCLKDDIIFCYLLCVFHLKSRDLGSSNIPFGMSESSYKLHCSSDTNYPHVHHLRKSYLI